MASLANPNDVVVLYMHTIDADGTPKNLTIDGSFPVIAPVNIPVSVALNNYKKFMDIELGGHHIESQQMDCGNGQILNYNLKNHTIDGACFYTKKGKYLLSLIVNHMTLDNQKRTSTFALRELVIGSELTIKGVDKQLSSGNNELVIGPLPAQVEFKADQVFRDFNLKNYEVIWDGDNDGISDKVNDTTFLFTYDVSKVYFPRVIFPAF